MFQPSSPRGPDQVACDKPTVLGIHKVRAYLLGWIVPGISLFQEEAHHGKKHAKVRLSGTVRARLLPTPIPLREMRNRVSLLVYHDECKRTSWRSCDLS